MKQVDQLVTRMAGFQSAFIICGQTYTRKLDIECINALGSLAASINKVIIASQNHKQFVTDTSCLCLDVYGHSLAGLEERARRTV